MNYLVFDLGGTASVPNVVKCKFENDANLIGALYHFKNLYEI